MLVWAPPAAAGDSAVGGYAWVEYVGGTPVLSGDAIDAARMWDNASLYARIGGFRKGYGILPGAIVAYNRGGFSPVSEPWGAATMGKPATPAALRCEYDALGGGGGGGLRLGWRAPEWDGGYPVASYEVSLQKWDEPQRGGAASSRDSIVVDAPPPNASAAAAAAAPAPAAAEAAAAAAAVVHVIDEALAAGEYRFRVTALNSQGDESARATSDSAAVPGGWCGWGPAPPSAAPAPSTSPSAPSRSPPPPPPRGGGGGASGARTAEARGGLADRVAALHAQAIKGGSHAAAHFDQCHDDVRLTADGAAGGFGARVVVAVVGGVEVRKGEGEEGEAPPPPRRTAAAAAAREAAGRILEVQLEETNRELIDTRPSSPPPARARRRRGPLGVAPHACPAPPLSAASDPATCARRSASSRAATARRAARRRRSCRRRTSRSSRRRRPRMQGEAARAVRARAAERRGRVAVAVGRLAAAGASDGGGGGRRGGDGGRRPSRTCGRNIPAGVRSGVGVGPTRRRAVETPAASSGRARCTAPARSGATRRRERRAGRRRPGGGARVSGTALATPRRRATSSGGCGGGRRGSRRTASAPPTARSGATPSGWRCSSSSSG